MGNNVDMEKRQPLYERDARAYEPPANYTYDPPVTAREVLEKFRASQSADEPKP